MISRRSPARLLQLAQQQGQVSANWGNPITKRLMSLYVPGGSGMSGRGTSAASCNDITNLAASTANGLSTPKYFRRDGTASGNPRPRLGGDIYGPSWEYETSGYTSIRAEPASSSTMPWRPNDNGGYVAGTVMAVAALTGTSIGTQSIFGFSGSSTSIFTVGFNGTMVWGRIATNTNREFQTSSISAYQPHAIFLTTRTQTDHEILARNLVTGEIYSATSTLDSGSAGTLANYLAIGGGQVYVPFQARIYMCAFWARGMTSDDMRIIARDPWAMFKPQPLLRIRRVSVVTTVFGDLAATTDDAALAAAGVVPAVGTLGATLDDATLAAEGGVPTVGDLAATTDDAGLSAYAQVGDGVIGGLGDLSINLDDATLDATGALDLIGSLAETLNDATLSAFAVFGTNGPYARRRFAVLNG